MGIPESEASPGGIPVDTDPGNPQRAAGVDDNVPREHGDPLAGPPAGGGPGQRATLTFSILGEKKQKVYDDGGVTWTPDPVSGVLTPDQLPPYSPITATCTIEGK